MSCINLNWVNRISILICVMLIALFRFFLEVQRIPVKQWGTSVRLLVYHTVTPSLMSDQREESLRRLEVEETAGDLETNQYFPWKRSKCCISRISVFYKTFSCSCLHTCYDENFVNICLSFGNEIGVFDLVKISWIVWSINAFVAI